MRDFELLKKQLWRDPDFLNLHADPRLLFIWSWTDPDTAICGLYRATETQLAQAIAPLNGSRIPASVYDRLERAVHALAPKPFLLYDDDNEVVWVPQRCKHTNRSAKAAALMRREYRACPASPLKAKFRRRYGRQLDL